MIQISQKAPEAGTPAKLRHVFGFLPRLGDRPITMPADERCEGVVVRMAVEPL